MEMTLRARAVAAIAGAAALSFAGAASAEVKLPDTLIWSAYDTGSSGHAQSVAIGKAFNRRNLFVFTSSGKGQARKFSFPINDYSACTTLPVVASFFRSGEV